MIKYYCECCSTSIDKSDVTNIKINGCGRNDNFHYCPNCIKRILAIINGVNNSNFRAVSDVLKEVPDPTIVLEEKRTEDSIAELKLPTEKTSEYKVWLIRPTGNARYRKSDPVDQIFTRTGTELSKLDCENGIIESMQPINNDWAYGYLRPSDTKELSLRSEISKTLRMLIMFYRGDPVNVIARRVGVTAQSMHYVLNNFGSANAYERWCRPNKVFKNSVGGTIDCGKLLTFIGGMLPWEEIKVECKVQRKDVREILTYFLDVIITEQVIDKFIKEVGG